MFRTVPGNHNNNSSRRISKFLEDSKHRQQAGSSSQQPVPSSVSARTSMSSASTVRRVFSLGFPTLPSSASSSVRMIANECSGWHLLEKDELEAVENDYFYQWFDGFFDMHGDLAVIDEDISQSPTYVETESEVSEDELDNVTQVPPSSSRLPPFSHLSPGGASWEFTS